MAYRIAFPLQPHLADMALDAVEQIRDEDGDLRAAGESFLDAVDAIAEEGLRYFFLQPVQLAGLGILTQKAVGAALSTGKKGVMMVARRVIRKLDREQLDRLADFMESIMEETPD